MPTKNVSSRATTRRARVPGRKGSPFQKTGTRRVTETGWVLNPIGIPGVPTEHQLDNLRHAMSVGDAAALVEAVSHCRQQQMPPPQWVVDELGLWLAEFVGLLTPPKHRPQIRRPRFAPWGRAYLAALRDWMIADHVEANRRAYGMTQAEAYDEAACRFRGTPLAGSPDALKKSAITHDRERNRDGFRGFRQTSSHGSFFLISIRKRTACHRRGTGGW